MSSLLRKDLLILGRSRLLLALLILYPAVIALLIGLALSRSPSRPRVAIVDETPPGETVQVGGQRVEVGRYAQRGAAATCTPCAPRAARTRSRRSSPARCSRRS